MLIGTLSFRIGAGILSNIVLGYLLARFIFSAKGGRNVVNAEKAYHATIGLELPCNRPADLKVFLTVTSPYVIKHDWQGYLTQILK